jgi:hypothetical protein
MYRSWLMQAVGKAVQLVWHRKISHCVLKKRMQTCKCMSKKGGGPARADSLAATRMQGQPIRNGERDGQCHPSQVQHTHSTRTSQHPRVSGLLTDIHPIGGVGTKGAAITATAPATTARRARGCTISNVWGEALRNHRTFGFLCSVSVSCDSMSMERGMGKRNMGTLGDTLGEESTRSLGQSTPRVQSRSR